MTNYFLFFLKKPKQKNEKDWNLLSSLFFKKSDPSILKFKWFNSLKPSYTQSKWTPKQDHHILRLLRQFYPNAFQQEKSNTTSNVCWSKMSYELSKITINPSEFKTDKKIKERWNNHLNPCVKKYLTKNYRTILR